MELKEQSFCNHALPEDRFKKQSLCNVSSAKKQHLVIREHLNRGRYLRPFLLYQENNKVFIGKGQEKGNILNLCSS